MKTEGITPRGRVIYEGVFQARAYDEKSEPRFNLTLAFNLDEITGMREIVDAIVNQKFGSSKKRFRSPFLDGDEMGKPYTAGLIVVRFKSKYPPGVVDHNKEDILEADDRFYSGCYARAFFDFWPYETPAEIGVSAWFRHVQKLGDGERLVSRTEAADVFDAVPVQDEDTGGW